MANIFILLYMYIHAHTYTHIHIYIQNRTRNKDEILMSIRIFISVTDRVSIADIYNYYLL